MKKYTILFILSAFAIAYANEGERLFDAKCAVCHIKTRPTQEMKETLVAPPINGVMRNIKTAFQDDRESAIAFIRDYTLAPNKESAKCKSMAVERFGIMPSQKDNVTPKELELIGSYLYDNFTFFLKNQNQKNKMLN